MKTEVAGILSLVKLALLVGTGFVAKEAKALPTSEKPNIVFILVDDMGYNDLGCYGNEVAHTPNIDRLAEEGIRFTQAYAGSAVCAPSRCVLMTGQHAGNAPIRGNTGGIPLPSSEQTIASVLQQAGYSTGGFGKWGLGDIGTTGAPEEQGFDLFFGYYHQFHAHNYYPNYLVKNGEKVEMPGRKGDPESYSHYAVVDQTLDFIRDHRDERFFCLAAWTPPHAKYQIPNSDPAWERFNSKPWSKAAKTHAAFVSMIDRHVGELVNLLDGLGLSKETVVFFCSDHGASRRFQGTLNSSGQLRGKKGTMYEGGLRVPMVVRWEDQIRAGSVNDLLWYFPDVMTTVAELAGVEEAVLDAADGISIAPTLLGNGAIPDSQARHDYLYWEYQPYNWIRGRYVKNGLRQALRWQEWKIVRHGEHKSWKLYDIAEDVGESNDLADERPDLVEHLEAMVDRVRESPPIQKEPKGAQGRRYR